MYSPKSSIRRYAVGCAGLLCLILVVALTSRCTSDSITGGENLAPQSPAPQSPAPENPPADPDPMGTLSEVGSVILLPDSLTVPVGETAQLTVIVRDTTGVAIANPHVEFFVSGLPRETVDGSGLVTPQRCGSGTVIARSGGVNSNTVRLHIGDPAGIGCWW